MEKMQHTSYTSLDDFYREMTAKLGTDIELFFRKGFIKKLVILMCLILPKLWKEQNNFRNALQQKEILQDKFNKRQKQGGICR
jgi:hypothetical protein